MKKKLLTALVFTVFPVFLLLAGCASTRERGSLSEAVEKSSDNYKGGRQVQDTHEERTCRRHHDRDDDDEEENNSTTTVVASAQPTAGDNGTPLYIPGRHYFGCRFQSSNRFSSNYTNSAGGALLWVDQYARKRAIELSLQLEMITTGEKSKLYGSVDDLADILIGLHGRRYSTPDYTFMGLYLKYGIDLNFLVWSYRNDLYSTVYNDRQEPIGTDTIRTDGLFGLSGDIGAGWSLLQTKRCRVSFELMAGGTLFWFQTFQSFHNDLFMPDGYVKAGLEVLFGSGTEH